MTLTPADSASASIVAGKRASHQWGRAHLHVAAASVRFSRRIVETLEDQSEFSTIREPLRSMLLPIPVGQEAVAYSAFESVLDNLRVAKSDYRAWVDYESAQWKETGIPSLDLSNLIGKLLAATTEGIPELERLPAVYLEVHQATCALCIEVYL